MISLQQQEDITQTKQLPSVRALKTSDVTQESKRRGKREAGGDNIHSITMLLDGCGPGRGFQMENSAELSCTVHLEKLHAPPE